MKIKAFAFGAWSRLRTQAIVAALVLTAAQGASAQVPEAPPAASGSPLPASSEPAPPPPERVPLIMLRGKQVTVFTRNGVVEGKLVEMSNISAVIERDGGGRVTLARDEITAARLRATPAPPTWGAGDKIPDGDKTPGEASADSSSEVRAQSGFQMAVETGYAVPFGSADQSLPQSDFVAGQVPLLVHIGGKLGHYFFVGGYMGLGFGGAGGSLADVCGIPDVSCSSLTLRIGLEMQLHILPGARFNPYIGYGVGIESTRVSASANGQTVSLRAVGPELARIIFGVDYRLNHVVGFGPYLNLSLGQYESLSLDLGSGGSQSGDVQSKALHGCVTVGARAALFP